VWLQVDQSVTGCNWTIPSPELLSFWDFVLTPETLLLLLLLLLSFVA
jgi:hypothetical protein